MASTTSTSGTSLTGLASGINWTTLINAMASAEQAPITAWNSEITTLNSKNSAYQTVGSDLSAVQNDLSQLSNPSFFQSVTTGSSNSGVATATAIAGTTPGTYTINISQLATAASLAGSAVSASPISSTGDVSGVTLGSSAFAVPITAGTFTINGQTITVSDSDTLQSVFDQINTATGGGVTASYNSTSDSITLQSSNPIELGSSADTSNFLQATGLFNNGSGTISSANRLGGLNIYANANASGLTTAITDGGGGNGSFTINGVTINYDASTDSVNDILDQINSSTAGVTASYNSVTQQFSLTNNTTGDVGITLTDNTGNFLAATGLSSGTTTQGKNLLYTVGNSGTLTNLTNTIQGTSIGVPGLTVTADDTGTAAITVSTDTSTIATAITQFVTDYNTAEKYIASQTATTTNSSGATVPGLLTGDYQIEEIADKLRTMATATPPGVTGNIQSVNDMGVTSNGTDNTLAVDSTTLNQALTNNLSAVAQIFSDPTNGVAGQLNTYLLNTIGGNGPALLSGENSFASQVTSLNTSITNLQAKITQDESTMQSEFVAMEDAINSANTAKEYLTAYFSAASASAAPAASSVNTGSSSSSSSSSTGSSTG